MKRIQILGPGCARCNTLAENAQTAARELGVDATVEKITDVDAILADAEAAGAAFLVLADSLARTVIAPTEIPIGVLTAFLGGPFFLFLLRRRRTPGPG